MNKSNGPLEALVEAASGAHPIPESEAAANASAEAAATAAAAAVAEGAATEPVHLPVPIPVPVVVAITAETQASAEILEGVEAAAAVTLPEPVALVHVDPLKSVEDDAVVAAATAAVAGESLSICGKY